MSVAVLMLAGSTSCLKKLAELKRQQEQQQAERTGGSGGGAPPAPSSSLPALDLPDRPSTVRTRIRQEGSRRYLEVGGKPFLVLAVQPDAWALAEPNEKAAAQFRYARDLGANTVEVPIPWIHVEPTPDHYTMDYVRWVMAQARQNDLSLVLLWFGSNVVGKTGSPTELKIVPDYVVSNTSAYPRVGIGPARAENPLDPNNPATLDREKRAFAKLLETVAAEDREGRVILWQILNEVGVLPETHVLSSESQLTEKLVQHVRALAQLQKRIHPVPSFMNFWEGLQGAKPFEFLARIPEIDFVGPDLYGKPGGFHIANRDYLAFRGNFLTQLDRYHQGRNLTFIPETNTAEYFKPYLLVFPLLGKVPGIGMNIWAVTTGSMKGYQPLVDGKSGTITESGERVREVYQALGRAMTPVVRAQGSGRLAWFMDGLGLPSGLSAGGISLSVSSMDGDGALLALRDADGALVLVGRQLAVTVSNPPGSRAERGRFEGERWVAMGAASTSPAGNGGLRVTLETAEVVRVASEH